MAGFSSTRFEKLFQDLLTVPVNIDPERDVFFESYCRVHPSMRKRLALYNSLIKKGDKKSLKLAATELETISAFAFAGLAGVKIKSYRSSGAQYDLVVSGSLGNARWQGVRALMGFPVEANTILVEVKSIPKRAPSHLVLRLAALIRTHFINDSIGVGVLLCPPGVSGQPKSGDPRAIALKDARLYQALFQAQTRIPIVVLDSHDMQHFIKRGGLMARLAARMRELRDLQGLTDSKEDVICEPCDVPDHMLAAAEWCNTGGAPRRRKKRR